MYREVRNGWKKHFDFILLDLFCLEVAFILASIIRNGQIWNGTNHTLYRSMLIVLALVELLTILLIEPFQNVLKRDKYEELVSISKQAVAIMLLLAFCLMVTQTGGQLSRIVYVLTLLLYMIFGYTGRLILKYHLKKHRAHKNGNSAMLIITESKYAKGMISAAKQNNYERYFLKGIVLTDVLGSREMISDIPIVADRETLFSYLNQEWIDEVMLGLPFEAKDSREIAAKIAEMGIVLHRKVAETEDIIGKRQLVERIGSGVYITTSMNVMSHRAIVMKRLLDIFISIFGCIFTGLLLLVFGPVIYAKSPGKIIFKQTRIGRNGKPFQLYKIRSMYPDAEKRKKELMNQNRSADGLMFKLANDPRIIGSEKGEGKGVGNFIRKYSLDEFPQFINVLKGDMSVIGTRPPTPDEWDKYEAHQRSRLAVKPGITGIWQVSGRSNITDFNEVVRLDQEYINEWSFSLDLRILVKTIGVVIGKKGAM